MSSDERNGIFFPIFINMKGKNCVVFGGGTVASRRVAGLLRFGAVVTVVSLDFSSDICELKAKRPDRLKLLKGEYEPSLLEKRDFVFSCVDSEKADIEIYRECKNRGIPVNIASNHEMCDFYFPALVEREDIVIGISSNGSSHKKVRKVAAKLREWISDCDLFNESDEDAKI